MVTQRKNQVLCMAVLHKGTLILQKSFPIFFQNTCSISVILVVISQLRSQNKVHQEFLFGKVVFSIAILISCHFVVLREKEDTLTSKIIFQ